MKGNSYEVIGDKMGGDADDYMLDTFGIPSITSEMGFFGQFIIVVGIFDIVEQ